MLTGREFENSTGKHEFADVLSDMFWHNDVPIVNENDVTASQEIKVGDNDKIGAILARAIGETAVVGGFGKVGYVILSDVDGLYENRRDPQSLIREVKLVGCYKHLAGSSGSAHGTGGSATKLEAAEICQSAGIPMWIANGREDNALQRALNGEIGTYFRPA